MEYNARIKKLIEMIKSEYDGVLLTPGSNFYYLTGLEPSSTMERLFLLLISAEGDMKILAPTLYRNQLENFWIEEKVFWEDSENPYEKFLNMIENIHFRTRKMLVEDSMPSVFLLNIEKFLPMKFEPLGSLMKNMRIKKDEEEINYLKKAAEIVDKVFYSILEGDIERRTEREIARKIEDLIYEYGGESISFSPIVASGPNSANPHHTPGERIIRDRDFVVLDYGAKYRGYCSDITRTIVLGNVPEQGEKVYSVVMEANEKAFQESKEGKRAMDIDYAARNTINLYGYGQHFTHRTGHGIGIDVHEDPFITSINSEIVEKGMVFTIEPGIYLLGRFGIRIEDDIAIVEKDGKRLTEATRELMKL
ncbi:MAG: M24 family metallopeptidase [Thermoplasmata archaeon]